MAAVAGSKGRISERVSATCGPQRALVQGLLEGELTSAGAADRLIASAALREIGIDTNMICNLDCRYCYLQDRTESKGLAPTEALTAWLLDQVARGVKLIAFIGKEPLADDRAVGLLKRLNQMRSGACASFRTGMVTNGTLIDRWIGQLEEADLSYLDISIDGLGEAENRLRGEGVAARALAGVERVVASRLRGRFATATVLTEASVGAYPAFVREMFGRGVPTCFASPVLRFAMSNAVDDEAVPLDRILRLTDALSAIDAKGEQQIIIDLPYKHTWSLLREGRVPLAEVQEDRHEALYWRMGGEVYLKLNPFPFSFWRALRVTHDGAAVLNMDLAAHPAYADGALGFEDIDASIFEAVAARGRAVLSAAIEGLAVQALDILHERHLAEQQHRDAALRPAA